MKFSAIIAVVASLAMVDATPILDRRASQSTYDLAYTKYANALNALKEYIKETKNLEAKELKQLNDTLAKAKKNYQQERKKKQEEKEKEEERMKEEEQQRYFTYLDTHV
jgi:Skp family chaperone for outer membrane proteins